MSKTTVPDYPGLPQGAFHADNTPPQALAVLGSVDPGVWSAALSTYVSVADPQTGRPYNGQPLEDAASGAIPLAASSCRSLAVTYSTNIDKQVTELEVAAATHLATAVDHIEHASGLLDEPMIGPDGETTDGRRLQAVQHADEELARQRSAEGDSRHTEQAWASGWRVLAATLLGALDILLLWKPLLNLSFESSSGGMFRWAIGIGLTGLQILAIEWCARSYVDKERQSVDRRGSVGDYNRPLKKGRIVSDRPTPTVQEVAEADKAMANAYRMLVLLASFIAAIGGVRVAVLGKRAALSIFEAALFGVIVGLILGVLVVLMARMYCRGNLLGDRLRIEREAMDEVNEKLQQAREAVAQERENALGALAEAELLSATAARIRTQTVADYWRAVQLAWTWLGLPHSRLDFESFEREALPDLTDSEPIRNDLRMKLARVNEWLADRPTVFDHALTVPMLPAATPPAPGTSPARFMPLMQPKDGQLMIAGPQLITLPPVPEPPHLWMFVGVGCTVVAVILSAFLSPDTEGPGEEAAAPVVSRYLGQ
ncbi:hypothetical protein [Actinophytocola oryzae]|nr:hypothetical protein [Actinophytocola oryzae]